MCDYSLEAYRSRPAKAGEEYQTHRFPSGSIGFVAPGDSSTAVCMACDTKLKLEDIPAEVQATYGVKASEEVIFTRVEPGPYHDGVLFANGVQISLQRLGPGVKGWVVDALTSPVWEPEPALAEAE